MRHATEDADLLTKSRTLLRNLPWYSSYIRGLWAIQGIGLFLLTVSSFFPALFHIGEAVFFVLLGSAIIVAWLEDHNLDIRTPVDCPLLLLLVWILFTLPFSLDPEYSFVEWRKLVAQCLVFYWAVYVMRTIASRFSVDTNRFSAVWGGWIRGQNFPRVIFFGVLLGSLGLSILAVEDFFARGGNWEDRAIRARAPESDYNWLSTYLVLSIPIAFYFGATSRLVRGKIFSFSTLGLGLLAHAASYSRAGWLASIAQVSSWGLVTRRQSLLLGVLLGILLVPLAAFELTQKGYQADTLHSWTMGTRLQVWRLGIEKMVSHPLVGIGYGNNNFQPVLADSPMGDSPMHLHNTVLMMGVGSGIPGLLLFLWVFVRLGRTLIPLPKRIQSTELDGQKLCLGIALVGFFCRNLFDYMFAGSLAYLFWILMACGLESYKKIPKKVTWGRMVSPGISS